MHHQADITSLAGQTLMKEATELPSTDSGNSFCPRIQHRNGTCGYRKDPSKYYILLVNTVCTVYLKVYEVFRSMLSHCFPYCVLY